MERKVDIMFDLVQNYQPSNNEVYQNNEQHYSNTDESNTQSNNDWNNDSSNKEDIDNRIEISDDSDDDSEEISDSESDEEEEIPKLSLAKVQDMSLSLSDVKKITVKEVVQCNNNIELEEVDSLDEIDDDDDNNDDDDDDNDTNNEDNTVIPNKNITVSKEAHDSASDNEDVDYHKLKVTELKAIAEAKGLTNYKSLKKDTLIHLIKSSE